jgi:hemoglobin
MSGPLDISHASDRLLPIAEMQSAASAGAQASEADIRALVDSFYERVQRDEVLGPIFAEHVADWSVHLPKMYDFWSTVVLRSGRYAGRPLEAHERIGGLEHRHFDRWLRLWTETVQDRLAVASHALFLIPAERMARTMSGAILGERKRG